MLIMEWLFIVTAWIVPRAATKTVTTKEKSDGEKLLHDRQGPGPAGELTSNGDVRDRRLLLPRVEGLPSLVQPPVTFVAADPGLGRGLVPPVPHHLAGCAVGLGVVPGRLDQQPAGMGIAGLRDRPLRPGTARGVFGRHQTDE